jgi:aerobic-type carbon monoxide dehydrogenase small subunit (CoxS/CutS family)
MTSFRLDGTDVSVAAAGITLLDALRDHLGVRSVKDGCSPQGQCGCCTVWVDGQPRVACVTPLARIAGRDVTTVGGLADRDRWAARFIEHGASQCGFCTPGIVMRVAALDPPRRADGAAVRQALLAHLCRCTGWQTIVEAVAAFDGPPGARRDDAARRRAEARAALEGGTSQLVAADVALGEGGFADDVAPAGALVAVRSSSGEWVVGESLADARRLAGKVQGRRTTAPLSWPIELPGGEWVRTLRTTWVEPAYLEPDASWCAPSGEPASPLANGGAFGGKVASVVRKVGRELADRHGRPVRVVMSREDTVRDGPKRPPIAAGVRADGTGVVRVARTPGVAAAIASVAPGLVVEEVDAVGPPTSSSLRAAGWAEAAVLLAALGDGPDSVRAPSGAVATAAVGRDGVHVRVRCGDPLDAVVLRSYCIGAAHMALGWVRSEGIAVDAAGLPLDLTIRSFGVLRAVDTPPIDIVIEPDDSPPVNGSDAVFAAVAAAAWRAAGYAAEWPVGRGYGRRP